MIEYDRSAWWHVTFSFMGTVLPRILGRVGLLTGLCLGVCLLNEYFFRRFQIPFADLDQLGHTVLGVALSMLIVFRTNTAYARFWEARSHWGAIINASRNLVRLGAAFAGPADDLGQLVAAFGMALKQKLRRSGDLSSIQLLVPGRIYEEMLKANDPPGVLARAMSDWVRRRLTDGRLVPTLALRMEELIGALVDQQGGCEKILRTPMPFVYAALIKQVLLLYLVTLPLVLAAKMGYAAPLTVAGVALGMLGIEEAGREIEDPFDTEPNSLPLESICETIARDTGEAALAER